MKDINEFFGILTLVTAVVVVVFIIARYTFLIKKLMIEKGQYPDHGNGKFKYLDVGCIVLGLGLGLVISAAYTAWDLSEDALDLLVWGTILIFGAVGLIVAHFIRKHLEE